ncbi:twin-arginine translocase TatA/TatE family subunit [Myxococcota bacterium]
MFGVSMTELVVILVVALIVVGPHKLPGMLRTWGQWIRRAQQLSSDVRQQTGIDQLLRAEGIEGLDGLRSMLRGDLRSLVQDMVQVSPTARAHVPNPYSEAYSEACSDLGHIDRYREYPPEGVDAEGALPDELLDAPDACSMTAASGPQVP